MRNPWLVISLVVVIGRASQTPPPKVSRSPVEPVAAAPASASPAGKAATPVAASPSPEEPARFLPSKDASAPRFAGGDGTSADEAVVVLAETEDEGIDLEHHWTFDHYGRFRKVRGGLAAAGGKHFDVITVELGDHTEKTIYFDITAFYGVMEKPAPSSPPPPPPQ